MICLHKEQRTEINHHFIKDKKTWGLTTGLETIFIVRLSQLSIGYGPLPVTVEVKVNRNPLLVTKHVTILVVTVTGRGPY